MTLSARNQLKGTVKSVVLDTVMAEVIVDIGGGQEVVSAITRHAVENLDIKAGDAVTAVVKSTEVMIDK
jgi:molybdopterin-binding protein